MIPDSEENRIHRVSKDHIFYSSDKTNQPVVTVKSGDSVIFECRKCLGANGAPVTGPIYIETIQPGDTLEAHIEEVKVADQGITRIVRGQGLLYDEFNEPKEKTIKVKDGLAHFSENIKIPISPFPGMLIVAPEDELIVNILSPHHLDSKQVTEGSTVYLPVYVEGALFGVGDLHSVQGDGELSGVAVETSGVIQIRFVVNPSKKIENPHIENADYYMTTGRGASTDDAARTALREMISWLMVEKGLSREEAYMLCSVTADMRINQVAGYPIKFCCARIEIPKSIFK